MLGSLVDALATYEFERALFDLCHEVLACNIANEDRETGIQRGQILIRLAPGKDQSEP